MYPRFEFVLIRGNVVEWKTKTRIGGDQRRNEASSTGAFSDKRTVLTFTAVADRPEKNCSLRERCQRTEPGSLRRLPEKNIPDYGGFLNIFAARKWEHSPAM